MIDRRGTFIIAEAGVNHNGSLDMAKRLVEEAKRAGADSIKFQTFRADRLASIDARKASYQEETTPVGESQYTMLKSLELSGDDHIELMDHCRKNDIMFLSSPFDEESADLLEHLGVTAFKIPSGEITNLPFLTHLAGKRKPLILSTGMSTLGEIEEALATFHSAGNSDVSLLHCVTEYPAPFDEINLNALISIRTAFGLPTGYSDHTRGIEIAIAAVALGAVIIEKHFTLDSTLPGPDHRASIEPLEFKRMVTAIRNVERAMGDGIKRPAACELRNIPIVRRSLVAARDIRAGETITSPDIVVKRPGTGIFPRDLNAVIGMRATSPIPRDTVLTWGHFK